MAKPRSDPSRQEQRRITPHSPYNFVNLQKQVLPALAEGETLPRQDCMAADRKSGKIQITLTARTPVFVSDGQKENPHFFRTPGGKHAIPGSTVRGMAREAMQILSFSPLRPGEDYEDSRIFFRRVAGAGNNVLGDLKNYYERTLGAKTGEKAITATNVHSGWILCEGGTYRIYPTREPYLRVSRRRPDVRQFGEYPLAGANAIKKEYHARTVPVAYSDDGQGKVVHICPRSAKTPQLKAGTLLYTGRWVQEKANPLYLFPEPDYDACPEEMSKEDELSYREDFENRRNTLTAYYHPEFWELPKEGERKPVFYLRTGGHLYCGMCQFLRIGYQYSLSGGLPEYDVDLEQFVDYPRAILGFASEEKSYRSHVSFSDCCQVGNEKEGAPVAMILSAPKPSWYAGYVEPEGDKAIHYNVSKAEKENAADEDPKPGFRLRGFKQYWLKDPVPTDVAPGKAKVGTQIRPLPVGTQFTGVVRYRDLTPAELGLLLWSLRLGMTGLEKEESSPCYQTIGMGKPYGYGRMQLHIDCLREYTPESLYGESFCSVSSCCWKGQDCDTRVIEYIRQYDDEATAKLGKKQVFHKKNQIRNFFWIKSQIQNGPDYNYMVLGEYRETNAPLPTLKEMRSSKESGQPSLALQQENSWQEKLSMWQQARNQQRRGRRK